MALVVKMLTSNYFAQDAPAQVLVSDGNVGMVLPVGAFEGYDGPALQTLLDTIRERHEVVRWRVGNKNPRNIYIVTATGTELHVGVMFTPALGRYVVEHLNTHGAASPPIPAGDVGEPVSPCD